MENDYTWHGVAPNTEQYEKALAELQEVNNGTRNKKCLWA